LDYFNAGMSIEQIAKERGLVAGTIQSHLAKAVEMGRIHIFKVVPENRVEEILQAMNEMHEAFSSKELFDRIGCKFSYGELRAAMAFAGKKSIRKTTEY